VSVSSSTELEVKLGAWPGFELPALDGAVDGLVAEPGDPVTMEATYLDAADLRLIRAGISLRHRTGEASEAGAWTLKLPSGGDDGGRGALRREELVVPGAAGEIPPELLVLVRPWLRTAPLRTVTHLETVRRSTALVVDGERLGEVDDDEVSVLQDGRVAARFREVEVEALDESVLDAVVARLREAGAGAPDPTPKLVRALGPRALQPAELAVGDLAADATAADILRAGIANAVLRIVEHDRVIRADEDDEGIHQARVGCRRLRSDLRTFGPLLDPAWSEPIRDELKWLAGELGAVRDLDVLGGRLRRQAERLEDGERAAVSVVLARLDRERARAVRTAVRALDSRHYLALLDRLVDAARAPLTLPEAEQPAKEIVPALAGTAFAKLRKGVKRLGKEPSDEALHELRIKAKRARYAADVAVPVVGDDARTYTKAVAGLQDVLGDHHDCAVAEEWLRAAARTATRAQAFAIGILVGAQQAEADRLRGEWRKAWKAIAKPKRTRWMGG